MENKTFIEWLKDPQEKPVELKLAPKVVEKPRYKCSGCGKPMNNNGYSGMCDFCFNCMMAAACCTVSVC